MQLAPGSRLAHYEISAHLGKGGMGEVWRATDTKLGRGVAIKVLPDEFVKDSERLGRFEREARLLASLDHSNIASIHGIEDFEGTKFLVMQLAEGEDLSDRLKRGAVPLDEALEIAKQLAEGLDAAHEKGVIHRDLKPANIKLDSDGNVRILDFGLAKAMDVEDGDSDITNSPTMVRAATHSGMILGTASYMSPEQARGKKVDKRADIWAFGVVLWEMLTGDRLFRGETVSDTLAAVLTREIDLDALPDNTPYSIRSLVARCLERNPKKRLRDIGEATLAIERVMDGESDAPRTVAAGSWSRMAIAGWVVAAVLLTALVAKFATGRTGAPQSESLKIRMALGDHEHPLGDSLGASAILSPDGETILYVAGEGETMVGSSRAITESLETQLFVRHLSELEGSALAGTEGAISPFFSPDGEWIGFFANGSLKKIALSGGAPMTLAAAVNPRGGAWGATNEIVFTPETETGLSIVSADGGEVRQLTTLDQATGVRSHRWPAFVGDTPWVVYGAQARASNYDESTLEVVNTRDGSVRELTQRGSYPRVIASGHLTWVRGSVLFAAPFDSEALATVGPPRPLIESIRALVESEALDDGTAHYSFSSNGRLVYRVGSFTSPDAFLVMVDRDGKEIARSPQAEHYSSPRISPDGRSVAVTLEGRSSADVWVWDVERNTMNRLTFSEDDERQPVWSSDGKTIAYFSTTSIRVKAADGSGTETTLAEGDKGLQVSSWSRDGNTIFAQQMTDDVSWDLVTIATNGQLAGTLTPYLSTAGTDVMAEISPDGKWVAFMSDETGRMNIHLRAFPDNGGRWQVSSEGSIFPRWSRNGKELIYVRGVNDMMAVDVDTSSGQPRIGRPQLLLSQAYVGRAPFPAYDVSTDGERFVVMVAEEEVKVDRENVVLVTNAFETLKALAPVK